VQHRLRVRAVTALCLPLGDGRVVARIRGLPRLGIVIAAKSMMLAYGRGAQRVTYGHVRVARRDTLGRPHAQLGGVSLDSGLAGIATAAAAAMRGWDKSGKKAMSSLIKCCVSWMREAQL